MAENEPSAQAEVEEASPERIANPWLAVALAWLVPGAGHVFLRRRLRGVVFLLIVAAAVWIGCALDGRLYSPESGKLLSYFGTLDHLALGIVYFLLRFVFDYQGNITSAGFEYGTAFLITAGLMNMLLILDAWDIALGKKE